MPMLVPNLLYTVCDEVYVQLWYSWTGSVSRLTSLMVSPYWKAKLSTFTLYSASPISSSTYGWMTKGLQLVWLIEMLNVYKELLFLSRFYFYFIQKIRGLSQFRLKNCKRENDFIMWVYQIKPKMVSANQYGFQNACRTEFLLYNKIFDPYFHYKNKKINTLFFLLQYQTSLFVLYS